ncbi:DUF3226 domain-containing protein [Geminocystis sp. CENA526]|uniref:DUF3226 domain-containing protein n=1 Tax=Geminocystis sp. CENA526 TaxID=1355871 RepID=UPI003D6DB3CA
MSNILIVESKNDRIFFDALINYLNLPIETEIIVNEYETLDGLSEKILIEKLKSLQARNLKKPIDKLGIIIDIDNYTIKERIEFINKCLNSIFSDINILKNISEFIEVSSPSNKIKIACYFTNVEGKGELETVLKAIKSHDSPHADCLEDWQKCLENQGRNIKQKDFDKFWVNIYIRYDTCSNKERKQAGKKCSMNNFEYVMTNKKDIWNFEDKNLQELKDFLFLFNEKVNE